MISTGIAEMISTGIVHNVKLHLVVVVVMTLVFFFFLIQHNVFYNNILVLTKVNITAFSEENNILVFDKANETKVNFTAFSEENNILVFDKANETKVNFTAFSEENNILVFDKANETKFNFTAFSEEWSQNFTSFLEEWPQTDVEMETSPLGQHVRLKNACLQVPGRSEAPILWTNFPSSSNMMETLNQLIGGLRLGAAELLPTIRNMDSVERNRLIIQSAPSYIEWTEDEQLLVPRFLNNNLFHAMENAYAVHSAFPSGNTSTATKRVFHIPTIQPFLDVADLSYFEFLNLIGVQEQRTIYGPVHNLSLRHVDISSADDDVTHRWMCFSKALLGHVPTPNFYSGILDGPYQQSYKSMLSNILNNLDINPHTTSSFCPSELMFILRYKDSDATRNARRVQNWPEVENELRARNISYHAVDIGTEQELRSFRAQVLLARCQRLLVAAHGQALWLTHFVLPSAAVIEILPYGFPSGDIYKNIAATNGVINYDEMTMETPWPVVEFDQFMNVEYQLRSKMYNESQIQNVRDSLIPLLLPRSYDLVTQYLQSLNITDATYLAHIMTRDQPLVVNVTDLVDRIENLLSVRSVV